MIKLIRLTRDGTEPHHTVGTRGFGMYGGDGEVICRFPNSPDHYRYPVEAVEIVAHGLPDDVDYTVPEAVDAFLSNMLTAVAYYHIITGTYLRLSVDPPETE